MDVINEHYNLFADENHLLHHRLNPTSDTSENELLFTAEYILLNEDLLYQDKELLAFSMVEFYMTEVFKGHKISHDNKTGLLVIDPNYTESIFRVGGRWWFHPRDIVFFGYRKYGALFFPLIWIVSLANIISCARTYKKSKDGSKHLTTSGKLLAMVRNLSADMPLTQKICTYLIRRNKHFGSWENVARIYFPDQEGIEHPVVTYIKRLDR